MPDLATLGVFTLAALALLVTPGPAVLYVIARSLDQGSMAGIVSVLGISVGTLFHIVAAAFGVSAIIASSVEAFTVMKILGAVYLIYLGVRRFLTKDEHETHLFKSQKLSKAFYQGIWVNLLNPKTALFFFAFLPQFVNVSAGNVSFQIIFLGIWFMLLGTFSDAIYAVLAGKLRHLLKGNVRFLRFQRYFASSVYIILGVATAFAGSGKK